MRQFLSKYTFLSLLSLFISINVFNQALPDPGIDPLDSTGYTNDSTVAIVKGKKIPTFDFSRTPVNELKRIFPHAEVYICKQKNLKVVKK